MSGYNITRSAEELLDKYESSQPSFSIHLYPDHWTLNAGPKFLYNNPVAVCLTSLILGCYLQGISHFWMTCVRTEYQWTFLSSLIPLGCPSMMVYRAVP